MNASAKLTAVTSLVLAAVLAAGLTINAPPYIPGTRLENGLIVRIQFDKPAYHTLDVVTASYDYYNPLKMPITFTPKAELQISAGYVDGSKTNQREAGSIPEPVTLPPGETFSTKVSRDPVLRPGTYSVDVNGTVGTVEVTQGQLVTRVSTDKEVYSTRDNSGTATLEIYNSGSTPMQYKRFSPLYLSYHYLGEPAGGPGHVTFVTWMDLYDTVQPGEVKKVWDEGFPIKKAGTLILDFNGVLRSVQILPD